MSSRERVQAAMRRKQPDRTPFDFALGFSPYQLEQFKLRTGQVDPDDYFGTDVRGVGIGPTQHAADYSRYHCNLPAGAYIDEWGQGHIPTKSDDAYHAHLEGYIYPMLGLSTAQDAHEYPLPDIDAEYRYAHLPARIAELQGRGLAVVAHMAMTIFEVAWYLRSMEQMLTDMVEDSPFATVLFDRITAKRENQAARLAALGPDIIMLGDDVGTQRAMLMSPKLWRRWLKPRLARVIAAAKCANPDVLIAYHTDGNAQPVIPDFIEIGIDILNPVQPECMDPFDLKRRFGDRLSFWGTLGTQTTLPFGTPDDVRASVRERIAQIGAGGGLLLAPTHMVEPEVPWENIVAYVDAVRDSEHTAAQSQAETP
jgi:uroporphyrinogen decarboxylase